MTRVLGIDLGTSSSAAAVLDGGEIRDIPPAEGGGEPGSFPSVVSFFEDGGCLIGGPALDQSVYNPRGTITGIKRKMGTGETVEAFGKTYLPQFVSALILMKIRADAEKFLGETVTRAVITVPASFDDNQRQATKDAARIAGLDAVRLLPEPVAAAITYGMEEAARMLVFDMGAGTLDVSIVDSDSGILEVVATSGPTNVGGMDMDAEVSSYLAKRLGGAKPDEQSAAQIFALAEALKIKLSEADKADFDEVLIAGGKQTRLSGRLTRTEFEGMITHILGEGETAIDRVVRDAGIGRDTIDKVVLVGGPTRIPAVRGMVAGALREPEAGINPDLAVARGAAMEGAVLAGDPSLPVLYQGLTLLSVTPLDLAEEAREGGHVRPVVMIPKNTPYPTEHTRTFYINNIMQTEARISVWQGDFEQDPGFVGNVNIGTFILHGLAAGKRNEIEVTYSIDHDGILTVRAAEIGTDTAQDLVVDRAWEGDGPPGELGYEEIKIHEKRYRNHMSPYEIPVEEQGRRQEGTEKTSWMCGCLSEARRILREHHSQFDPAFLDWARFELFVQLDIQYAYAYILLTGGPVYPIGIHNALNEDTRENRRSLVITLVHEILHAIHPDWGHNRIRPEEKRLANLAGYYDTYREKEVMFLSGKMSLCNNATGIPGGGNRITCPD